MGVSSHESQWPCHITMWQCGQWEWSRASNKGCGALTHSMNSIVIVNWLLNQVMSLWSVIALGQWEDTSNSGTDYQVWLLMVMRSQPQFELSYYHRVCRFWGPTEGWHLGKFWTLMIEKIMVVISAMGIILWTWDTHNSHNNAMSNLALNVS